MLTGEALKTSEARLAEAQQIAHPGNWVWKIDFWTGTGACIEMNRAAEEVLGGSTGDCKGLAFGNATCRVSVLEDPKGRDRNGAAEILDVKPTTLESRMAKLGLQRGDSGSEIS